MGACQNRVTLKALANSSPGFALKPWVQKCPGSLLATLKELRGFAVNKRPAQLLQSCAFKKWDPFFPGLPKRNPGLELANAFSVIHFRYVFSRDGSYSTFCSILSSVYC